MNNHIDHEGAAPPPPLDGSYPDLRARYQSRIYSPDSVDRATARHQLALLNGGPSAPRPQERAEAPPTPVLLCQMIEQAVGSLHERPNGDLEGACPWHASSSGRCLVVFADGARWWCRSCGRGGDAAAWLALVEGVSLAQARRRLGLPSRSHSRARRRPTLRVEVAAWPSD